MNRKVKIRHLYKFSKDNWFHANSFTKVNKFTLDRMHSNQNMNKKMLVKNKNKRLA